MKYLKIIVLIVGACLGGMAIYVLAAPPKSPLDVAAFNSKKYDLEVVYSRPYKKGRLIFGSVENQALVPYKNYWRTGANAATTFMTGSDIVFGGKEVPAGKYRLYSVPGAESWSIFLNTEAEKYFAIMEPDKSKDLLEIEVNTSIIDSPIEQLTFDFSNDSTGVSLNLKWDTILITIPIK
tara:strand:- start:440 stop:979 length:540 start_codon:yes stop_codon:yes gene_type:complete